MKKLVLGTIAVVVILMLVLPACNSQSPAAKPSIASNAVSSAPTVPPKPAVTKWKMQTSFAESGPLGRWPMSGMYELEYWADWIGKATNGRLEIEVVKAGAVFPVAESYSNVAKGVLPGASSTGQYWVGALPEANIENFLPFAAETREEWWTLAETYGFAKAIHEVYAKHNVYHIMWPGSKYFSIGASFDMSSPETLKGKKFRASGISADVLAVMGANPVNIPLAEMYMGMKLGTIDGYWAGAVVLEMLKMKEVTKTYLVDPLMGMPAGNILINMDAYNALPKDIKDIIDRDSMRILQANALDYAAQEDYMVRHIPEVKFVQWSPSDKIRVRKMVIQTIWPKLASLSPDSKKLFDIAMEFAKDFGKL